MAVPTDTGTPRQRLLATFAQYLHQDRYDALADAPIRRAALVSALERAAVDVYQFVPVGGYRIWLPFTCAVDALATNLGSPICAANIVTRYFAGDPGAFVEAGQRSCDMLADNIESAAAFARAR